MSELQEAAHRAFLPVADEFRILRSIREEEMAERTRFIASLVVVLAFTVFVALVA